MYLLDLFCIICFVTLVIIYTTVSISAILALFDCTLYLIKLIRDRKKRN